MTLWHYLVVRFCKKLVHNNMQRREIWSNGFLAYVGESDAMLHLDFNGEDKIDLRVKGISYNYIPQMRLGIYWFKLGHTRCKQVVNTVTQKLMQKIL